jgi:CRP-like cAMP-binding protein
MSASWQTSVYFCLNMDCMELTPAFEKARKTHPARGLTQTTGSAAIRNPIAMLVRHFALFSDISLAACSEIVSVGREKAFARRQTIFSQGDPIEKVYLLTSGSFKTTQLGQNGSEVILRLCGGGDLIGSCKPTGTRPVHRCVAQALQPSRALIWDAATFESLCVRYPALRQNLARILDEQLGELEERYREISTECVPLRLSREISRLANRVGERVKDSVKINLSREELAQLTGTTLFTVSRLLSQWKEQGIVSPGREIVTINDPHALAELFERQHWAG